MLWYGAVDCAECDAEARWAWLGSERGKSVRMVARLKRAKDAGANNIDAILNTRLDELVGVPTRMSKWCAANDVLYIRDLISYTYEDLIKIPGIGSRTLRVFDRAIERHVGISLDELSRSNDLVRWYERSDDGEKKQVFEDRDQSDWRNLRIDTISLFPTRLENWCLAHRIETLEALVRFSEEELAKERNIGRLTIDRYKKAVRYATGKSPSKLRSELKNDSQSESTEILLRNWDDLEGALLEDARDTSLDKFDFPQRMLTYCANNQIYTIGELVKIPYRVLLSTRGVGVKTISDSFDALRLRGEVLKPEWRGCGDVPLKSDRQACLSDFENLIDLLRGELKSLDADERFVLTRRIGIIVPSVTLEQIGALMSVSRERIRQIQEAAIDRLLRRSPVFEEMAQALIERCGEGLCPLSELNEDAFFHPLASVPNDVPFFLDRFTKKRVRAVSIGDELFLTALDADIDRAYAGYRERAKGASFPLPMSALREELVKALPRELLSAESVFWERVSGEVAVEQTGGDFVALSFGTSRRAALLALLRERRSAVSVREVQSVFGRGPMPDEVVYVRRGHVIDPQFLPGFDTWKSRIIPRCVKHMREEGPERQWTTFELHDALAEEVKLPEWSTPWTLSGMCKRAKELRYLGRGRVVLADVDGFTRRRFIRDAIFKVLDAEGHWLDQDELTQRVLAKVGGSPETLALALYESAMFVQWHGRRWGLLDRDLPGGGAALRVAGDSLEAELERRATGMTAHEVAMWRVHLGHPFSDWAVEAFQCAARRHPGLRVNRSGSIGLAVWPDALIPSRKNVICEYLESSGSRVERDMVREKVEARFGGSMAPSQIALVAASIGYRSDGCVFIRRQMNESRT